MFSFFKFSMFCWWGKWIDFVVMILAFDRPEKYANSKQFRESFAFASQVVEFASYSLSFLISIFFLRANETRDNIRFFFLNQIFISPSPHLNCQIEICKFQFVLKFTNFNFFLGCYMRWLWWMCAWTRIWKICGLNRGGQNEKNKKMRRKKNSFCTKINSNTPEITWKSLKQIFAHPGLNKCRATSWTFQCSSSKAS